MLYDYVGMRTCGGGEPLAAERIEVAPPPAGTVRVKVAASGVCHADISTAKRRTPTHMPVTPGHEIAGIVDAVGPAVAGWLAGDRVAVGWFGGSCGHCPACRRGDVVHCSARQTPGISYPGGWAQAVTVPADALARIPDELGFFEAAPMGCAGVTTFNAIRHAEVLSGGRVAVFGIGGLGHLAVQFADKLGYEVVAIARGPERAELATALGTDIYIDSAAADAGQALHDMGGADLILSTVSSTIAVSGLLRGLAAHGRLTLIGVDGGSLQIPVADLVSNALTVTGHLTGSASDIEETMQFAARNNVRPMIERMPLTRVNDAVERLESGLARFRIVLDPTSAALS